MIKVIGIASLEYAVLSIDPYIPFSFSADPRITPDPFMWRTGDLDDKMFEIAVDTNSSLIKYATLVSYTSAIHRGQAPDKPRTQIDGIPIIDVAVFAERIVDHKEDFLLFRYDNRHILFINPMIPLRNYTCIQCGRVGFFCDTEGFLQAVEFKDLSVHEQKILDQTLNYAK